MNIVKHFFKKRKWYNHHFKEQNYEIYDVYYCDDIDIALNQEPEYEFISKDVIFDKTNHENILIDELENIIDFYKQKWLLGNIHIQLSSKILDFNNPNIISLKLRIWSDSKKNLDYHLGV